VESKSEVISHTTQRRIYGKYVTSKMWEQTIQQSKQGHFGQ